jgi:hypothetical protein
LDDSGFHGRGGNPRMFIQLTRCPARSNRLIAETFQGFVRTSKRASL